MVLKSLPPNWSTLKFIHYLCREVAKQHWGCCENFAARFNVNTSIPAGSFNHEEVPAWSPGGTVCSLLQGGACLYCARVYVQWEPAGVPQEWGRQESTVWGPGVYSSSGILRGFKNYSNIIMGYFIVDVIMFMKLCSSMYSKKFLFKYGTVNQLLSHFRCCSMSYV